MNKNISLMVLFLISSTAFGNEISQSQKQWVLKFKRKLERTAPAPSEMLLNTDPEPKIGDDYKDLYNKKDLSGWTAIGGTSTSEAKGDIVVSTHVPKASNTYLWTSNEYDNFIFSREIKWIIGCNSGVMFRSNTRKNKDGSLKIYGPQVEMESPGQGRGWSGGIYGQGCGGYFYPLILNAHEEARAAVKNDDWNRITLKAEGRNIKTWINGVPAANWNTEEYLKGSLGFQLHEGKQGLVHFRNIKIKELK